jgi:hypothetical protein
MTAPRARLIPLLTRLDAPDLAAQLWAVRDDRDLPAHVRGEMLDVLGHEATQRGVSRDGSPNRFGRELDELADAVDLEELLGTGKGPAEDMSR